MISKLYEKFYSSLGVCTDTRKLKAGEMFFALKGPNFDGNQYAKFALENGATYAVIDDSQYFIDDRTLLVNDVLVVLQSLANYHRKQLNIPVIGIAGSNGKTTSKELIHAVLSTTYTTFATEGNLNNHIGVPLSILSISNKTQIAILELGANHVKELELLCKIAEPNYGLITNNGLDHLEGYGSLEGVIQGNSEIYYWLLKNNGIPFVNAQDEQLMRMASRFSKKVIYGNEQSRVTRHSPYLEIELQNKKVIQTHLIGEYNIHNINAALKIGEYFGVNEDLAIQAIANYQPKNNRSQLIEKNGIKIILDCYNANPSSVELAIDSFSKLDYKHKTLILGDMFELGNYEASEHKRIANLALNHNFEKIILCGKAFTDTMTKAQNLLLFKDRQQLENYLQSNPLKTEAVLIKGSRGMQMEKIVDFI